jgi:hypothetical protein
VHVMRFMDNATGSNPFEKLNLLRSFFGLPRGPDPSLEPAERFSHQPGATGSHPSFEFDQGAKPKGTGAESGDCFP